MRRSVLVVNGQDETGEVLRTVLAERGIEVLEAPRAQQGLRLARERQPDLIVVDLEVAAADDPAEELLAESRERQTPLVILGSVRRGLSDAGRESVVPKPYHYGPLIRRIEALLAPQRAAA